MNKIIKEGDNVTWVCNERFIFNNFYQSRNKENRMKYKNRNSLSMKLVELDIKLSIYATVLHEPVQTMQTACLTIIFPSSHIHITLLPHTQLVNFLLVWYIKPLV